MKLYLMRHGQANSPQLDPQRGLTTQGRLEIEQLAARLATRGIRFAQVLHSKKARAKQTAEIMASVLAPEVSLYIHNGIKPDDDPAELLPEIETWHEDTLVCSHLPFVPGLLAELTGQVQEMAIVPGTIFCLQKEAAQWRLEWVEAP